MNALTWSQAPLHRFWSWHLVYWFGYLLLKYTHLAVLLPLQDELSWPYLATYTLLALINLVVTGYLGQRDLAQTMPLPQQMRRLLYWIVPLCLLLLPLRQHLILTYSPNSNAWKSSFAEQMIATVPLVLLPLLGWLAVYLLIKANQGYQQEFVAQQALLNQARAARLKVLRYQLNPHFMFNTLNALNSLIISRQGQLAEQLIQNLSTFLRHSLKNKDETLIPLPQELDALAAYLAIQQVRFGERLQLNWHIAALPKLQIPPLLLQPLAENAVLLERYRLWLELAPARSQALPGASEPLPNHRLLMVANRLLGLQALQLIEQGNPRAALELLQQDIVRLRRQLAEADTLIGKIIVASMLSADLERIALWHARGLLPDPAPIAGLSESERSLLMPMQHEVSGIARLFCNLRQLGLEEHGALPLLLFYKPQRSINQALPSYQYPAELSQLPPDRLAQALAEREPMEPVSPWSQPNNPIGQILLNIATPAFENYAGRVQDLDARIRLFNLLGQLPDEESELLAALTTLPGADNPYYPGQPPRWDATTGTLCFDGPLPDERGVRCLPLR